jgi:hypothetical protein
VSSTATLSPTSGSWSTSATPAVASPTH